MQREIDEGLLPSCQYAIAKDGELIVQRTYGDATDDTRYCIFSSTKAFAVSAFWTLLGEGKVSVDDKVADHLPGFEENGKEDVTVEHVLLHTAGFPNGIMGPPHWSTHESRLGVYPRWKLDWEPGTKFMYHATSAHWVLMDILTKLTGDGPPRVHQAAHPRADRAEALRARACSRTSRRTSRRSSTSARR